MSTNSEPEKSILKAMIDALQPPLDHWLKSCADIPEVGDEVPPELVVALHSEALCEDGITVLRLFDLVDGRVGIQQFREDDEPGPIRYGD